MQKLYFIFFADKCDQIIHCVDKSDESNCLCNKNEFQCQCYKNNPVDCKFKSEFFKDFTGCIPKEQYHDNITQCPDGSDESQFTRNALCGDFNVTITRLSDLTEDDLIDFASYNNSSCHKVSSLQCDIDNCNKTDFICMSTCHNDTLKCNRSFQCNDGSLGLAFQFCNNNIDCPDKSDEIEDEVGFKCFGFKSTRKCVLPQRNLHDDVAQCKDESDLCRNNSCFECFDRRLMISLKQVCDGVFDCYDWSDECLCEVNFNKQSCKDRFLFSCLHPTTLDKQKNNYTTRSFNLTRRINVNYDKIKSTKSCKTRRKEQYIATLCDGRPECSDLSDECDCENPLEFCNDTCHDILLVGDRYCDGIEDEFYKIINKSNCPKGFDEINCPKRFYCKNGNKISIDQNYVCDSKVDCDDESDEIDCKTENKKVFSSETEMIASPVLKYCFWIIGMIVIYGNLYVIISTTRNLKNAKFNQVIKYNNLIILNISVADTIMGVYLLIIAVHSAYYSGYYDKFDHEWRSSLLCSMTGNLAVLSSETSCLFMVLLTSYRLYTMYKPFSTLSSSNQKYKMLFIVVWLISLIIAGLPITSQTSEYFMHSAEFSNQFIRSRIWNVEKITKFACRLAKLTNKSMENSSRGWFSTKSYLKKHFPDYSPGLEFGYYGPTSVCMPRFFIVQGETAWEYSLFVITLNFLCFFYIAVGYIFVFIRSSKSQIKINPKLREKNKSTMQKRISRIIITDFLCWIPICIIAFVKLSGIYVDDVAYVVSAALLLPINSAVNPLLYSSLPDDIIKALKTLSSKIKTLQNK